MSGIQIQGSGGSILAVDETSQALRASLRPLDVDTDGGAFALGAVSGTIAAGASANSELFAFRNASAVNTALIRRVTFSVHTLGTGFTAGVGLFYLKAARAYTALATVGTAITLSGNNAKLRTAHATPTCEAIIADTAALTSGTETADTTPLVRRAATFSTAVQTVLVDNAVLLDMKGGSSYPLTLAQNEGFIIYGTVPATGTWVMNVNVEWDEVSNSLV